MNTPEVWFPNLGIQINELNDIAISIFGIDIYWYGIIIGSAVLLGLLLATHEAGRTGQSKDDYVDFTLWAIVFCIIGARLYYVAFTWGDYKDNLLNILNLREGGIAIYGAIIAGVLTAIIFTRKRKLDFLLFADTAAPSLLLGQIIGRWGNFFNREAFGGFTDGLFAMRYLKSQVRAGDMTESILQNIITVNGAEYIQVHPTFLYESLWNLGVFILLMILRKKKGFNGEIFGLYFVGYGIGRLWIEGLRTDSLILWGTTIPVSQIISIVIILLGFAILWWGHKRKIEETNITK